MHDSIAHVRTQTFGMIEENEKKDQSLCKRVNYIFQEFDALKSRYEVEVPGTQAR